MPYTYERKPRPEYKWVYERQGFAIVARRVRAFWD